jgi:hypothetical protein
MLPSKRRGRGMADLRLEAMQGQYPGRRIVEQGCDPAGILPALAHAIERVSRKAVDLFHSGNISR